MTAHSWSVTDFYALVRYGSHFQFFGVSGVPDPAIASLVTRIQIRATKTNSLPNESQDPLIRVQESLLDLALTLEHLILTKDPP